MVSLSFPSFLLYFFFSFLFFCLLPFLLFYLIFSSLFLFFNFFFVSLGPSVSFSFIHKGPENPSRANSSSPLAIPSTFFLHFFLGSSRKFATMLHVVLGRIITARFARTHFFLAYFLTHLQKRTARILWWSPLSVSHDANFFFLILVEEEEEKGWEVWGNEARESENR